jgi:fumarylpyruvate hydrolase
MNSPVYLCTPPPVYLLPERGQSARLPINRLFFDGRNCHAHGVPVFKEKQWLANKYQTC